MVVNALFNALSGIRTASRKLQNSANNLANLQTPGFKKSRASISEVESGGSRLSGVTRISSQGFLQPTSNPLDLAINGNGFFQVATADGGVGFTRAGSFKLDSTGRLVTADGNPLVPEITIPGGNTGVAISPSGQVSAIIGGSPVAVGQIQLADFNNPGGLSAQGGNLFFQTSGSGSLVSGNPGAGSLGTVVSGALEGSNVDIAEEVINQIIAKTAFKANANVIRIADQMIGTVLDIKA